MSPRTGVLAAVAIALLCCGGSRDAEPPARVSTAVLDPAQHAVGATLTGLRLTGLTATPSTEEPGGWVGSARFAGTVNVSGHYGSHPAYPELGELCFFPDAASGERLPRFANDHRKTWFCFTNRREAVQRLAPPPSSGTAEIVIDDFHYVFEHSDVNNAARLVEVLQRTPDSQSGASSNPSLRQTPPG